MKKLVSLLAILLLCATSLFAQAPGKFSYQAVVRNSSNSLVTDAQVGVRVSILQGSADGSAVYVETQTATTNANGLLTIEIGGGKAEQGEFAGIDWANGPYFLKTETDPNGGSNYTVTSTQQLLSVPYALYSREAGNGFSGDYNDLKNKPAIPQNVGELANDAGYITMSNLPHSPKGGGTDDAGVVQTTVCGEIDLCQMAAQLAQMEARWAVLLPTVITKAVSNVTETTATCGGIVTAAGYDEVTARGVCLGTEPNPMVDGNHTSNGTGTGSFTTDLDNLMPSTTYYVRAYAINSIDTAYGEEMSFTTAEEIPLDTCGTLTLPYSENFDSFTTSTTTLTGVEPTCWKLVHEDVQMSDETRPQICYSNSYAYSGDYSLRLHYRGIYAMPKLPENIEMNNVTLEMSLKQPKKYYALEVGVWEDGGTFVPVATFNNSTTSYKRVECDFSEYTGNGRRIAFRNIPGSNEIYNYSYNFIDDIVLNYTAPACPGTPTVTDVDGNVYNTVLIGSQCWMKENLRTTKYADGTAIPAGGSTTSNTDPYYYDYSSSSIPLEERGYLYNWAAAMHGATSSNAVPSGVQGICPNGWHLPSDAEWTALEQTQTTLSVTGTGWRGDHAGRLAGGDRWNSSSNGSTPGNMSYVARNASGFEAVPAGDCSGSSFYGMGSSAFFWTSTRYSSSMSTCDIGNNRSANNATGFSAVPAGRFIGSEINGSGYVASFWSSTQYSIDRPSDAHHRYLYYYYPSVYRSSNGKHIGYSVRCLRD